MDEEGLFYIQQGSVTLAVRAGNQAYGYDLQLELKDFGKYPKGIVPVLM